MRILLFGKTGQLGWELQRCLAPLGEVIALDYPEIDLRQPETLPGLIRAARPEAIVNACAYTAVDQAESQAELALAINGLAPGVMAEAAREIGAAFIHYSTDYVFDGTKGSPYGENDTPNPLGVYGSSKLAGEQAVAAVGGASLTLRTSWVYSLRRDSFVTKVLGWARQNPSLKVVTDQVSGPTWARVLAEISAQVLARAGGSYQPSANSGQQAGGGEVFGWIEERSGLYHLAGSGYASRMEWAQAILELDPHPEEQVVQELSPALTSDFPTPAQRPLYSALDCQRFTQVFGLQLPDWKAALRLAMEAM